MRLRRCYRFLPAVLCMAVLFWFSSIPGDEVARAINPLYTQVPNIGKSTPIPWLKVGHFIGYSGLSAALLYAFRPGSWRAMLYSLSLTALYAITDEIHQVFTPGRHAGFNDVVIDIGAAAWILFVIEIVHRMRRSKNANQQ